MPALVVLFLALTAAAVALFGSVRTGFVTLIAVHMIVPATLVVPNPVTSLMTFHRLVLVALVARVILGLRGRELDRRVLRPNAIHVAFVIFLLVSLVNGVLAAPGPPNAPVAPWFVVLDQFVFLVVVLALIRTIDNIRWVAAVVALGVGVQASFAVGEHFVHNSWARYWFEGVHSQIFSSPASKLGVRGDVRVRANADFPLEYSWICVMLLPLAVIASTQAVRTRARWLWRLIPVLVVLGIAWSTSRSALAGLGVITAVLAIGGWRDRRVRYAVLAATVGALTFWIATPGLRHNYSSIPSGSTDFRSNQLPRILESVAHHPIAGLGFGRLTILGFKETDTSYLFHYAATGVLGLEAFALLLITTIVVAWWALRGPPRVERAIGVAALAGILAAILGAFAFDEFNVAGSGTVFWLLVAIAIAARESAGTETVRARLPHDISGWAPRAALVLIAAAGLLAGIGVRRVAPVRTSALIRVETIRGDRIGPSHDVVIFLGTLTGKTTCDMVLTAARSSPGAQSRCIPLNASPGAREVWFDGGTPIRTTNLVRRVRNEVALIDGDVIPLRPLESGKAAVARTAPLWLPIAAAGLFVLALTSNRRRPDRPVETVAVHR